MATAPHESPATTLDQISQVTLANSPTIRQAEQTWQAARARALQASLYPNPTLGTASPQLAGSQTQYNAYVNQDLVTQGKLKLDTAAAQRAARQAELSLVRARFDALTTARQKFYTALVTQQRVEVLRGMLRIARASLLASEGLLAHQTGTREDVLLLRIALSKNEADLVNMLTLAETSKRELAAATGVYDLAIASLEGNLAQPLPQYDLLAAQQGALANNALVSSAEVEIGRAEYLLRRAQVEPFPNLNMMGGYQNQVSGPNTPTSQGMYQVQMIVPLWNRNQGNIRAAEANISAAVAGLEKTRAQLAGDVAAALGRYRTACQLTDRYEREILPAATQLQTMAAQQYQTGEIDFLRYLSSQRTLLDANLSYLNAQEARWTAAAELAGMLQSEQFP